MGRLGTDALAYRVKNTFVEIGNPNDDGANRFQGRRMSNDYQVPSPEKGLSLLEANSNYNFVPDTPSPMLHPSQAGLDPRGAMPLGDAGMGFGGEMTLPPAFGDGGACGEDAFAMQMTGFDGQDMQGFCGVPAMIWDASIGGYTPCGWYCPMDALSGPGAGPGGGPVADQGGPLAHSTDGNMPLETMLEVPGVGFDGGINMDSDQRGGANGEPASWKEDGQNFQFGSLDQGTLMEVLQEGQFGNDSQRGWNSDVNGMGGAMEQQGLTQALGPDGSLLEEQGWQVPDGSQAFEQGGGPLMDMMPDGQVWNVDQGMMLEQEHSKDVYGDGQGWGATDARALGQDMPQDSNGSFKDGQGWGADGEARGWNRVKGGRSGRRQQQQQQQQQQVSQETQSPDGSDVGLDNTDLQGNSGADQAPANNGPIGCTTVMLRNIPNKYTREMLVKQLSQDFRGRFDFVYLPIDFKNRCNVGYGFINFRTVDACDEFVTKFNGVDVRKCLPGLNSRKVAEVTPARVQGLEENVRRLRNGPVMNELVHHPEWMPLLLGDDGEERPFPLPDQPCAPVKPRRRAGREEHGGAGCAGGARGW